jgi:hypothetical protein
LHGKAEADKGKYARNRNIFVISKMGVILLYESTNASQGKKDKEQAGHLQPKGIKSPAKGDQYRFGTGNDGAEQPVFLYNTLHGVFDCRNLRHFTYCSPKPGVFLGKNKTQVTPLASKVTAPEEFAVNTRFKQLMKELGEAINGSLAESEQIAQVIARIKEEGFDVFLVLEATVGFNRQDQDDEAADVPSALVGARAKNGDPEFSVSAHDVRFLKSLRISVDDAA